ncbi:MAG TPA: hypothetical protein VLE46_03855 [Nitrospira sp.]|nr:hypothetical protein [Nitrospira sp.]
MGQCIERFPTVVVTVVVIKYFTANGKENAVHHSYDSVTPMKNW